MLHTLPGALFDFLHARWCAHGEQHTRHPMTRSRCRINSPILAGHALYVREGDSHAQRKERPCSSPRDKARVSGETVRKSASTTHLASEAQTYSSETHSEGSHVCRHQQSVNPCRNAPPFLQPNELLSGDSSAVPIHAIIITISTFPPMWIVRGPYEETALLALARCMQKAPLES